MVHGHANGGFIQADFERPGDTQAVVRRQQQESALGDRVASAHRNHREGVRQQAAGQGGAGGNQSLGRIRAGGHDLQIIATGEDTGLATQHHNRAVLLGLIQRRVDRSNHVRRQGIDLAIVQAQVGNAIGKTVGNQFAHQKVLESGLRRQAALTIRQCTN